MILELDVGNSRIKWRLLAADSLAAIGSGHVANVAELRALPGLQAGIELVRLCSVRGGDINGQIEDWVRGGLGVELLQARVTRSCGGVTNQYADPNRLGIDRWLAMLGAYKRAAGACIVIDSGTAFTLDALDAKGLHLGGYIIPGLGLMRSSLEANTAIRLSEDFSSSSQALGHSTDEAVFNGTVSALLATIRLLSQELRGATGLRTYFAGGDAELLHGLAGIEDSEIALSLVFEGLGVACPRPELERRRT